MAFAAEYIGGNQLGCRLPGLSYYHIYYLHEAADCAPYDEGTEVIAQYAADTAFDKGDTEEVQDSPDEQ